MAGDLNISMTRAESFKFPGMVRLRSAEWQGEAAGVRLSSQIYGPLLFVLAIHETGKYIDEKSELGQSTNEIGVLTKTVVTEGFKESN